MCVEKHENKTKIDRLIASIDKLSTQLEFVASKPENCRIVDALDALGLALASHGHVWTAEERDLYDTARAWLTSADDYKDAGSSALKRYFLPEPLPEPHPQSARV